MNQGDYVYFCISGDFDPLEASKKIPIKPDRSVHKHSKDSKRKIPVESSLRYAFTRSDTPIADVYVMSEKVVDILEPHKISIKSVMEEFRAETSLNVVLDYPIDEDIVVPAVGFSSRVVSFLSEVNASIDLDTYRK